jgi:hypothetical protein
MDITRLSTAKRMRMNLQSVSMRRKKTNKPLPRHRHMPRNISEFSLCNDQTSSLLIQNFEAKAL